MLADLLVSRTLIPRLGDLKRRELHHVDALDILLALKLLKAAVGDDWLDIDAVDSRRDGGPVFFQLCPIDDFGAEHD